jgi:hypothetical protein
VNFEIMADKSLQTVHMDVERFADVLIDILERLVGVEVHKIKISIFPERIYGPPCALKAAGAPPTIPSPASLQKHLERTISLCGGLMQTYMADDGPVLEIEFVSSDALPL